MVGKTDSTRFYLPLPLFPTAFPSGIHLANQINRKKKKILILPSPSTPASNIHTLTVFLMLLVKDKNLIYNLKIHERIRFLRYGYF